MSPYPLPEKTPVIAYYGDDLTGSTAVMESTAFAGLETVLFLDAPDQKRLADFPHARVIGIAGDARARAPEWMAQNLPHFFNALKATGAPIIHYKVCSTFDSAPQIGSIGKAAEIGKSLFSEPVPMLIGDLGMGRYQCFGHLFAMANQVPYRIDRHPVMSRHPVTPMDEADLIRHLQKQTDLKIGLVDFVSLHRGTAGALIAKHREAGIDILAFDMLDELSQVEAGKLIWNQCSQQRFCIGSQGLENALVAYWQNEKWLELIEPPKAAQPCSQMLAVSGSVSPTTAVQIDHAKAQGFVTLALDLTQIGDEALWRGSAEALFAQAHSALQQGGDVLIYSARGPDDAAVGHFKTVLATQGHSAEQLNEMIGDRLGQLADRLLRAHPVPRLVISGGDTSGRVARKLGIDALTALAPMAPGAPLCRAHCASSPHHGLELLLKGGQVGGPDIFTRTKTGSAA